MARIRTYSPRAKDIQPQWRVIDAEGQTLGRLATQIATVLRGKDKPIFTRHMIVGDFVVVVNAEKIRVTGQKAQKKIYYHHTQHPGGLRAVPYSVMMDRFPGRIIEHAVKGMLPHNRLGRQLMRRLHVYAGPGHPHGAQLRAGQGKGRQTPSEPETTPEAAEIQQPQPRRQRRAAQTTEEATTATPRRGRSRAAAAEESTEETTPPIAEQQTEDAVETPATEQTTAEVAAEETRTETDQPETTEDASASTAETDSGETAAARPATRRRRTSS